MFKVEVIADNTGTWAGNGIAFDTKEKAEDYAKNLASRWTAVREWRVVEVLEPNEILQHVKAIEAKIANNNSATYITPDELATLTDMSIEVMLDEGGDIALCSQCNEDDALVGPDRQFCKHGFPSLAFVYGLEETDAA